VSSYAVIVVLPLSDFLHVRICLIYGFFAAGVCLGMQCAVIEFARNVLNMPTANSTEVDPETKSPVVRSSCQ